LNSSSVKNWAIIFSILGYGNSRAMFLGISCGSCR